VFEARKQGFFDVISRASQVLACPARFERATYALEAEKMM